MSILHTGGGEAAKERGMGLALSTHEAWKIAFERSAVQLANSGLPFTSEDVVDEVGLPTNAKGMNLNNAVGAMMNALAKQGVIVKTGNRVKPRRTSSHAREINQWRGRRSDDA